jgi:hypothetical protein
LSDKVLKAVEYLLYPLVRLIIARSISYGTFTDVIKFVMVKEAEKQLKLKNAEAISDSRLSIITGIHRKEVKRIRALKSNDVASYEPSLASQVVARWAGDRKLRTKTGIRKLARKKTSNTDYDFEDLVRSISTDIRPKVVLEELIDRGLVTEDEDDRLELHPENLALKQDQEETLQYLSLNIHDHLATSVNNLINPGQKQLDRCVHYHGLSAGAVEKLKQLAEKHAMESLVTINKAAQELIKEEQSKGELRMNFGTYFHHEKTKQD